MTDPAGIAHVAHAAYRALKQDAVDQAGGPTDLLPILTVAAVGARPFGTPCGRPLRRRGPRHCLLLDRQATSRCSTKGAANAFVERDRRRYPTYRKPMSTSDRLGIYLVGFTLHRSPAEAREAAEAQRALSRLAGDATGVAHWDQVLGFLTAYCDADEVRHRQEGLS